MLKKLSLITGLCFISMHSLAANDVYGTVSEIHHRSNTEQHDHAIYVRFNLAENATSIAECEQSPADLIWFLDLSSPVSQYQYELLKTSYQQQLPVRVIGQSDICSKGPTHTDTIIEISPWSWPSIIQQRNTAPEVTDKFL